MNAPELIDYYFHRERLTWGVKTRAGIELWFSWTECGLLGPHDSSAAVAGKIDECIEEGGLPPFLCRRVSDRFERLLNQIRDTVDPRRQAVAISKIV